MHFILCQVEVERTFVLKRICRRRLRFHQMVPSIRPALSVKKLSLVTNHLEIFISPVEQSFSPKFNRFLKRYGLKIARENKVTDISTHNPQEDASTLSRTRSSGDYMKDKK